MSRHDSPGPEPGATTTRTATNATNAATAPGTAAMVAPRCDPAPATRRRELRATLERRRASRALDRLIYGDLPPLVLVDRGDWYRVTGCDLGVRERNYAGAELRASGWTP